jgi:hypothetical protein
VAKDEGGVMREIYDLRFMIYDLGRRWEDERVARMFVFAAEGQWSRGGGD